MPYENLVRERIEAGETVFGASATTLSTAMIEVYADIGFDYVWLDHEHIGAASTDATNFEGLRRAADAADIEPVVRIESGEGPVIRKVLDAGIRTFVVPRVETADEVRQVVKAARFSYDGEPGDRGVGTCLASNWGNSAADYTQTEDEAVFPGVMLENRTALENVEEILSVPGLCWVQLGPADLSVSLGHPMEPDHPAVRDAIGQLFDAADAHDVPVGAVAGYEGGVEAAVEAGAEMVLVGGEVSAARQFLGDGLQRGLAAVEDRNRA